MVVFWSCFGWKTLLILKFTDWKNNHFHPYLIDDVPKQSKRFSKYPWEQQNPAYHVYQLDFILSQNSVTLLSLVDNMPREVE